MNKIMLFSVLMLTMMIFGCTESQIMTGNVVKDNGCVVAPPHITGDTLYKTKQTLVFTPEGESSKTFVDTCVGKTYMRKYTCVQNDKGEWTYKKELYKCKTLDANSYCDADVGACVIPGEPGTPGLDCNVDTTNKIVTVGKGESKPQFDCDGKNKIQYGCSTDLKKIVRVGDPELCPNGCKDGVCQDAAACIATDKVRKGTAEKPLHECNGGNQIDWGCVEGGIAKTATTDCGAMGCDPTSGLCKENPCNDHNSYNDIYSSGYVDKTGEDRKTDSCTSGKLTYYYCRDDGKVGHADKSCTCNGDGSACAAPTSCKKYDKGGSEVTSKNYNGQEKVVTNDETLWDYCKDDGKTVVELWCSTTGITYEEHLCASGICEKGACKTGDCTEELNSGDDIYTGETVHYTDAGADQSRTDVCDPISKILTKYSCKADGSLNSKTVHCTAGCSLDGKACLPTTCADSDEPGATTDVFGMKYDVQGTVTTQDTSQTDVCLDGKDLKEYYCDHLKMKSTVHTCVGVCASGACSNDCSTMDYNCDGKIDDKDVAAVQKLFTDSTTLDIGKVIDLGKSCKNLGIFAGSYLLDRVTADTKTVTLSPSDYGDAIELPIQYCIPCTDTDNGIKPLIKGSVTYYEAGDMKTKTDSCNADGTLTEYSCDAGPNGVLSQLVTSPPFDCSTLVPAKICSAGKCQ